MKQIAINSTFVCSVLASQLCFCYHCIWKPG